MSDEDLLIGGKKEEAPAPQGSTGLQVPADLVKVSLFGVFKTSEKADPNSTEDEYVEQVFPITKPRNVPDEDVAQFVWSGKFLQQGALRAIGSGGEINFYPLDRFKRFVIRVGSVVGVTL
jgi:hypothetical protein